MWKLRSEHSCQILGISVSVVDQLKPRTRDLFTGKGGSTFSADRGTTLAKAARKRCDRADKWPTSGLGTRDFSDSWREVQATICRSTKLVVALDPNSETAWRARIRGEVGDSEGTVAIPAQWCGRGANPHTA